MAPQEGVLQVAVLEEGLLEEGLLEEGLLEVVVPVSKDYVQAGMAAEAVRANGGDVLKTINSLTNDADSVHTLASSLFDDPRDAATLVAKAGFDPSAATVALDASRHDAKTMATDSSYAKTMATDSSYAQTIASTPGDRARS